MTSLLSAADSMGFRERLARLSLLSMAIPYAPFFLWVQLCPPTAPLPDWSSLVGFGITATCHGLLRGFGELWLRWRCGADARMPADERDQAIANRAARIAYFTLMAGVILVGVVMPFQAAGWRLIHATIAAIVLAEVVHDGVIAWSYWRGRS